VKRAFPLPRLLRRFRRDESGLAMLEFAFTLPIFATLCLTGAELTNFIITKMRVSQIALHLADNAARIGVGTQLQAKTISESDINDLMTGADLQSGELGLFTNGRVTISSIEPDPVNAGKSTIRWQRCKGNKTAMGSTYGAGGATNLTGVGPAGRQVAAATDGVTMFVEVRYQYTPLIKTSLSPTTTFDEIASMMVRDRRDTSDDTKLPNGTNNPNPQHPLGVYKVSGVTASTC
jgi:Flp pilus assembly protein TadG